jgi:hypothetical protein
MWIFCLTAATCASIAAGYSVITAHCFAVIPNFRFDMVSMHAGPSTTCTFQPVFVIEWTTACIPSRFGRWRAEQKTTEPTATAAVGKGFSAARAALPGADAGTSSA